MKARTIKRQKKIVKAIKVACRVNNEEALEMVPVFIRKAA